MSPQPTAGKAAKARRPKDGASPPKSNAQLQAEYIMAAPFDGPGRPEIFRDGTPPEIQYLYRTGHIVIRDQYQDQVRQLLIDAGQIEATDGLLGDPVIRGIRLVRVVDTTAALNAVQNGVRGNPGLGPGVAGPDHVVSITGDAGTCPANEPEPVGPASAPVPGVATDPGAGEGVKVLVIDTGYDDTIPNLPWWMLGVTGDPDPGITWPAGRKTLAKYAGHGTFIAGIVRSIAPRAEVRVVSAFPFAGAQWETELVKLLEMELSQEHPDIISMSAGTRAYPGGPLVLEAFHGNLLLNHKGVGLVVAAGNDSDRTFFWPAASPYTVSVGALAGNLRDRAQFSNFGGWVDVYALGQDVVNVFPDGVYTYHERPYVPPDVPTPRVATFSGMAMWSGTSFSTPVVSGLIAARMSRTGENAQEAAAGLLAIAHGQARPGVGAVLLT